MSCAEDTHTTGIHSYVRGLMMSGIIVTTTKAATSGSVSADAAVNLVIETFDEFGAGLAYTTADYAFTATV